jgi:flagellar biogenesis protein FliO
MDAALTWVQAHRPARTPRRLRLCETVSFGEKRFAAVVEFEDRRFLIGGAANSVSLLADLQQVSFANALSQKVSVTQEAK